MINKLEKLGKIIEAIGLGIIGGSIIWMISIDLVAGFSLLGKGIMVYASGMFIKTVSQLIKYFKS